MNQFQQRMLTRLTTAWSETRSAPAAVTAQSAAADGAVRLVIHVPPLRADLGAHAQPGSHLGAMTKVIVIDRMGRIASNHATLL